MNMIKKHLVKRCCASCQHRDFNEDEKRVCTLMNILAEDNTFVCHAWDISEGLAKVGESLGLQAKCQKEEIFEKMHRI